MEEAAIRMLQPKLGTIRGALDLNTETHLYPPLRQRLVTSGHIKWPAAQSLDERSNSVIHY